MLRARLAVAAVGLPLLGLLVAAPEPVFAGAVTLVLAAAAVELSLAATPEAPRSIAVSAGAATALVAAWARQASDFPFWTLIPLPALALYGLLRPGPGPRRAVEAWWLGTVAYVGILGAHWLLLRGEPDGRSWVIVLLAVVFATDTGAYAAGRAIGRHRMAPRISPGKTWEGAGGGLLAGAAAGVAAPLLLDLEPGAALLAAIAALVPAAAEAGDLVESALKRRIGVKDASHLLPGHGGLLDRMDSLLLAGPLLYWIVQLL